MTLDPFDAYLEDDDPIPYDDDDQYRDRHEEAYNEMLMNGGDL